MTVVVRQPMADDSGLFTDGTAVNKAFVDSVYDQIDDQSHSTANPTIKPKATTDEVVTARGSKSSVDARLDVSLNEDGTLKTQASLVTVAQVQSALGSRNIAVNGDLDDWSAGAAAAPDSFTLTGAGAVIARTGPAQADTFTFGTGLNGFAAKITRVGNDWKLTQDVIAAGVFANFANVKGQTVTVAVKGKTGIANLLRVVIDDGVSTDVSSYHTGGGTEEHLTAVHVISNSATKLSVYVEGDSSNGDAYVGGFMVVFASLAPSDWSPLSQTPDANSTRRGLVGTGTQSIPGAKQFDVTPEYKGGGGAAYGQKVSGLIEASVDLAQHTSVTPGPTTFSSFALEAGFLNTNNRGIRVTCWGTFAANANVKQLAVLFGATSVTVLNGGFNGGAWKVVFEIWRTGATTQKMVVMETGRSAGVGDSTALVAAPGETLANAITVATKGTAATTNSDLVQEGFYIEAIGV